MVALSQYTYATLFAAAILAVEGIGLAVRAASRGARGAGARRFFGARCRWRRQFLLRVPLTVLASEVCEGLGLSNFGLQLPAAAAGAGGWRDQRGLRLGYYLTALEGLARSPFIGSMLGRRKAAQPAQRPVGRVERHGLAGYGGDGRHAVADGARGVPRAEKSPARAHLVLTGIAVGATALLGTVVYSRDNRGRGDDGRAFGAGGRSGAGVRSRQRSWVLRLSRARANLAHGHDAVLHGKAHVAAGEKHAVDPARFVLIAGAGSWASVSRRALRLSCGTGASTPGSARTSRAASGAGAKPPSASGWLSV